MDLPAAFARSLCNRRPIALPGQRSQDHPANQSRPDETSTTHPPLQDIARRTSTQAGVGQSSMSTVLPPRFLQSASHHLSLQTVYNGNYSQLPNFELPSTISPSALTGPPHVTTGVASSSATQSNPTPLHEQQPLSILDTSSQYTGGSQLNIPGSGLPGYPVPGLDLRRASTQNQSLPDASPSETCYIYIHQWGVLIQAQRDSSQPRSYIYKDIIDKYRPQAITRPYPPNERTMHGFQYLHGEYLDEELTIQDQTQRRVQLRLTAISRGSSDNETKIGLILGLDYLAPSSAHQENPVAFQRRYTVHGPGTGFQSLGMELQNITQNFPMNPVFHPSQQGGQRYFTEEGLSTSSRPQTSFLGVESLPTTVSSSQTGSGFLTSLPASPAFSYEHSLYQVSRSMTPPSTRLFTLLRGTNSDPVTRWAENATAQSAIPVMLEGS